MSLNKEFFDELISDTNFVRANEGSLMTSRQKVTTPLYVINCIYGGGLPLSVITRISGHPGSGKSTFSYQCMANYQKEYPNGVSVIYDMEASMDDSRLQVLGVDTNNVLRLPATSLEDAFSSMFALFEKLKDRIKEYPDLTTFQIYDTISVGGTEKQHASVESGGNAFNAGSMMESSRIIKQNLQNIFPYVEKFPIFLGLLEQVFTHIGTYQSTVKASQNFGLDHASHSHIVFGQPKEEIENGFVMGVNSMVELKKSKLSPKFRDIPCYIDVTRGGRIDEIESFLRYISNPNINIIKASSWWSINDTLKEMSEMYPEIADGVKQYAKSHRKNEFVELAKNDKDLVNLLQIRLIDVIDDIYIGLKETNEDYKLQLMSECKYFDEYLKNKKKK